MASHVRVGGSWSEVSEMHVRVGGSWQEVQEAWVRDGGVWRRFHQALDAASLSAGWSNIVLTYPTITGANEDRTISWTKGGARNVSLGFSIGLAGVIEYRLNSGSWTTYSAPFSMSSGDTLGWRYTGSGGDESVTISVTDDAQGGTIGTFGVAITGSP